MAAMEFKDDCVLVLVTVPNLETGRKLASAVVSEHLAACVNIVPGLESHYWWEEKVENDPECLLLLKTIRQSLSDLEKAIQQRHPYDVPEFVVLPFLGGSKGYLDWVRKSVVKK